MAKLDGVRNNIINGPNLAVLDLGDKFSGLCKVLPVLKPMEEVQAIIEQRVKYGRDADIIGLGCIRANVPLYVYRFVAIRSAHLFALIRWRGLLPWTHSQFAASATGCSSASLFYA